VAASVCIAIDQPQIMASGSIIMVVLNIISSIILVKLFGFYGVAWGTLLSVNAGTIYFLFRLHKALAVPLLKLIRITLPAFLVTLFAAASTHIINLFLSAMAITLTRSTALLALLIQGVIYSIIYILVASHVKLFNAADMDFFSQKFPFIRNLLPQVFKGYGK
jgi:peptidoglycan biosynthesis protein MviN/MurJ (putative lipid II flippase)